jgi:hypothetical protein
VSDLLYLCESCGVAQRDVHCWLCGQLCVGGQQWFFTSTAQTYEQHVNEMPESTVAQVVASTPAFVHG